MGEVVCNQDRDEPKKADVSIHSIGFCPYCRGSLWQVRVESNYCFRCGQKVYWEESE